MGSRLSIGVFVGVVVMVGCGDDDHAPTHASVGPDASVDVPATLRIDATSRPFGSVTVNETSPTATFVISNTGEETSGVLAAMLQRTDAASYEITDDDCTTTLAPSASCSIEVRFAPTDAGPKLASLAVSAVPGGTVMATLEGTGIALGALTISGSTNALGGVVVDELGETVATFTVTNTGGSEIGPLVTQAAGADPADFVKSADLCAGMTLAPAAMCTFEVRFAPLSAGPKSASFDVIAGLDGLDGIVRGAVTGIGLAPAQLVTTFPHQEFGSIVVDKTVSMTLVFRNSGDVATTTLTQSVTGAGSFSASAEGTCLDGAVAPNATCTVIVRFAPITTGGAAAELTVSGAPDGGSVTVMLSGTGIVGSELSISPTPHSYADTMVSENSAQTFTITNNSDGPSGTLVTSIGGADRSQFGIVSGTDTCGGFSIGAGASCTISVAFAPTTGGPATATIVAASTTVGPVTAGLSGLGIAPARLVIVPTTMNFGTVMTASSTAAQTFTVTNVGGQASLVTATLGGLQSTEFTIAGNSCTNALAPGARCNIEIRFQPTGVGTRAATLDVVATEGGSSATATLSGEAVATGQLVFIPSTFNFPTTLIGDSSAAQTFTLLNTGTVTTGTIDIATVGANYTATHDCTPLEANGTCTISVTFTPSAVGPRLASIQATATPGGTAGAVLSGVGQPHLEIIALDGSAAFAEAHDFGSGVINSTRASDVFITVRNNTSGSQGLAPSSSAPFSIIESYGSPPQFATVSNTCDGSIDDDGGLCTVRVRFQPTTIGTKLGTINFSIGPDAVDQATLHLVGVGIDSLFITALDDTSFGTIRLNSTSTPLSVRVTNQVGSTTTGAITTSLPTGTGIQIDTDTCMNETLAGAASCMITLTFEPIALGEVSAILGVTASPGGSPSITVTGTGVEPIGAVPTDLLLTPSSVLENAPSNTLVGTFSTIDADVGDNTFTYTFRAGGVDNALFTIAGNELRTTAVFDFEIDSSFTIRVRSTDSSLQIFDDELTVTVTDVDDVAPSAVDDSFTVAEDSGATTLDVVLNDTDLDTGTNLVASVTVPTHGGTVLIIGVGTQVSYQPAADFTGTEMFSYTLNGGSTAIVAMTVSGIDDPPVAVMDIATVAEDSAATAVDVLGNDTDVDGGPKTITAVAQGANGSVVITGGGAGLTYAPTAGFVGPDSFTYTLNGGSTATVSMTVSAVDDLPTAVTDASSVAEDSGAATVDVLGNDTDIDGGPKTIASVSQGGNGGTVVITGSGTGLTYAPSDNFIGTDTFTYTLNGGSTVTVTMTVTAVDDPPTAVADASSVAEDSGATTVDVLGNDTDIDGGPKTIIAVTQGEGGAVVITDTGTGLTYAPHANLSGTDTFTYTLNGGSTATVTMTVSAVDDLPTAVADTSSVAEDSGATAVDVLSNDIDIDGGTKTISAITQGDNGSVVITGGGTGLTYAPSANFTGADGFTYTLNGGSIGTVTMTVTAVDDQPVAVMDSASVAEDSGATAVEVLSNDTDIDGGLTMIRAITQGDNGSVVITGGGTGLTYAPNANFTGADTFTYTLDGGSIGTVTMTVTALDDLPMAVMDTATVAEDSGATAIDVLGNDTDIDGGPKTIGAITQGAHGAVVITGDGSGLTYAPNAHFNGPDSFTYTLNSGSIGTVDLTVTAVVDLIIAADATVTVLESSEATTFDLVAIATDSDNDGGPGAVISSITPDLPAHGELSITVDSTSVTYTPDPGFFGTYGFTYTLDSGSIGTVTIIVSPLNTSVSTNTDPAGGIEGYQGTNSISIDPNNPLHIIAASNTFYKDPTSTCQSPTGGAANTYGTIALFGSTDGGANWTYNCAPWPATMTGGVTGATFWFGSYPTLTWDNLGRAYVSYLLVSQSASAYGAAIVVARSSDSGASWQNLGTVVNGIASTTQGNDKEMMAIDNTSGQPFSHPGRLYVIWQAANAEKIAFSDNGTAWTTVNFPSNTGAGGGNVVVGADGAVYVIWNRYNVETVVFSKSTDGGATWTTPQVIATLALQSYGTNNKPPAQDKRGVNGFGAIDVDRNLASPYFGHLYVSFSDFPSGTTTGADLNVYVVRSANGGTSWSSRLKVNDDSFGATQMLPWLAVDQSDGTVNVSWYDTRLDPVNRKTQVYYARSSDGGASFEPNVLVSNADSAWTNGINYSVESSADNASFNSNQFGDYSGLAASNRRVRPAWTDSRMFFPVPDTQSPTRREDSATATITNCSAPSAIASPVVNSSTAGSVAVSWGAPNQWGAKATNGTYAVFRDTTPVFPSGSALASDLTATSYVDTTGVNGTTYYYFVRAKNNCAGTALTPMTSDSVASAAVVFGSSGTATGTLQGTVMAGATPVSGVLVTAGTLSTTTNSSGFYLFAGIGAASYTVSASPAGYSAASVSGVVVPNGGTTDQNLALSAVPTASCLTDTTYADFSTSAGSNLDIVGVSGDVTLTNLGVEGTDQISSPAAVSTTNNLSATTWTGQTFRAGVSGKLTKMTVGLGLASGTSGTITVEIRNLNGINPGTTVLATSTLGPVTNVGSSAIYTTTFATPATLVSGTSYSVVLRLSVGNTVFGVRGSTAGGSSLANGQVFTTTTSGTTWTSVAADLLLTTYVTPPLSYPLSGNLSSSVKDANSVVGIVSRWSTLSWTAASPANTTVRFQAAASNNISGPFDFVGPDGTASSFFTTSGESLSQFNGSRYLKYKALLSTTDNIVTPTLNAATVCFDNVAP